MNISLPDSLKEWIEHQVADGGYATASEYVRELIRADEKRKAEDQLEALLLTGLQGEATEFTPDEWKTIRKEALAKVKARQKGR